MTINFNRITLTNAENALENRDNNQSHTYPHKQGDPKFNRSGYALRR